MENLNLRELEASGLFCFKRGDIPQALDYFKRIANLQGASINNFAHLGRAYAKLDLFEEAKEAFEAFLNTQIDAFVERFQLGLVYLELGEKNLSIECWDRCLSIQPTFPPALYYKAAILAKDNFQEDAIELLNKFLNNVEKSNIYYQTARELLDSIENSQNDSSSLVIHKNMNSNGEFNAD